MSHSDLGPHENETASDCRREYVRSALHLQASMRDADGNDQACIILDISPGGARIFTRELPEPEAEISVHILGVGRLAGRVVRVDAPAFALRFTLCEGEQERASRAIVWQFNRDRLHLSQSCGDYQLPGEEVQTLTLGDGREIDVSVCDVSVQGVAYLSSTLPPVGDRVMAGSLGGEVVRHFSNGFAVVFDPPEDVRIAAAG